MYTDFAENQVIIGNKVKFQKWGLSCDAKHGCITSGAEFDCSRNQYAGSNGKCRKATTHLRFVNETIPSAVKPMEFTLLDQVG